MLIRPMDIAPAGIGLPNLEQGIRNTATVFIANIAVNNDALASGSPLCWMVRSLSFSRTVSWPYTGPVNSDNVCGMMTNGLVGARLTVLL
jgi:hypothetical protein